MHFLFSLCMVHENVLFFTSEMQTRRLKKEINNIRMLHHKSCTHTLSKVNSLKKPRDRKVTKTLATVNQWPITIKMDTSYLWRAMMPPLSLIVYHLHILLRGCRYRVIRIAHGKHKQVSLVASRDSDITMSKTSVKVWEIDDKSLPNPLSSMTMMTSPQNSPLPQFYKTSHTDAC